MGENNTVANTLKNAVLLSQPKISSLGSAPDVDISLSLSAICALNGLLMSRTRMGMYHVMS